jgi:hypothetical protein
MPNPRIPDTIPPFSVWRKGSWQPFSYNPSVADAVKMLKCQDVNPDHFIIKEFGTSNQWDGNGNPIK